MEINELISLFFNAISLMKSIYKKIKKRKKAKELIMAYKVLEELHDSNKIPYVMGIKRKE